MVSSHNGEDGPDSVRVEKLSHAIASRLRARIVTGQLKAGDKLPPETELLTQFNVSRPIAREALRILEVESLISMGRGTRTGATVLAPSPERAASYAAMVLASNGTTYGELHQSRVFMEPTLVLELAKRSDVQLLDELQALLAAAERFMKEQDYPSAIRCFSTFHAKMLRTADNRATGLILLILKSLSEHSLSVFQEQSTPLLENITPEDLSLTVQLQKTFTAYSKLVDLVRQGKAQEAREHWHKYMLQVGDFMQRTGLAERQMQHSS